MFGYCHWITMWCLPRALYNLRRKLDVLVRNTKYILKYNEWIFKTIDKNGVKYDGVSRYINLSFPFLQVANRILTNDNNKILNIFHFLVKSDTRWNVYRKRVHKGSSCQEVIRTCWGGIFIALNSDDNQECFRINYKA